MSVPELRFPEFSGEWEDQTLGEALDATLGGGTPSRRKSSFWNGDIPWASVKDLDNKKYKESTIEFITKEGLNKSSSKLIPTDSLIISTRMGLGRGFINKKPISINQDLKGLIPNDKINIEFLFYWYARKSDYIETLGKGSTVKGLRLEELHALNFLFPSLKEQQKITSFLSKVDEKIEKLEKKQELWETYKKGIIQQIFSQKLRFKDENGEDYPDWEEKKLVDIAKFSKGKGISKNDISDDGIECIRYGELYTTYKEEIKEIISKTNLKVNELVLSDENDIIIPTSGETAIDIATASCVMKRGIAIGGDTTIIKTKENGLFLSYYLNSRRNTIAGLAQGVSVVHLYSSQLKRLELKIPIIEEQIKIANFLSNIEMKIEQMTKELDINRIFKKGLLQQMFC